MYVPVDDETRKKILEHYQKGQGSLQDYARIYHLSVEEVLEIVGETDLGEVDIRKTGDLVDASEMGKTGASEIRGSEKVDVPFTTN